MGKNNEKGYEKLKNTVEEFKNAYDESEKEVELLKKKIEKLEKEKKCKNCKKLERENKKLKLENKKLKKELRSVSAKLRSYENPNTPISQRLGKNPKNKGDKGNRPGGKKGHKGHFRPDDVPTDFKSVEAQGCYHCSSGDVEKTGEFKEESVVGVRKVCGKRVVQYTKYEYKCNCCGKTFVSDVDIIPKKGIFSFSFVVETLDLRINDRLTLQQISDRLCVTYEVKISNAGIVKVIFNASSQFETSYADLAFKLSQERVVYVDETPFKINGVTYYLWTFTSENYQLFYMTKSRSWKVLKKILGKGNPNMVIVSDGWSAYRVYCEEYNIHLQRCWAHLKRESKECRELKNGEEIHQTLSKLFEKMKRLREKPPPIHKRKKIKKEMEKELREKIENIEGCERIEKLKTKILNGLPYWFTCVVHLEADPTNNAAERSLRGPIVIRKISGGFKSLKAAQAAAITYTIVKHYTRNHPQTYRKKLEELLRKTNKPWLKNKPKTIIRTIKKS